MKKITSLFLPLVLLAAMALLAGLWAGLLRLGWSIPVLMPALPMQHGPLMISGFLGTLIALERVAALRKRWMLLAPLSSGIGWLVSLALPGSWPGPFLITLGSLFAVGILLVMLRREPSVYMAAMALGMGCWLAGNILWLGGLPIYRVIGLWAAFLVLTISGERLELSRVLHLKAHHFRLFAIAAGIFLLGAILSSLLPDPGVRLQGAGMLALAAWLFRYDIARRNLHHKLALTRFIAACLFGGYIWLALGGLLNIVLGAQSGGLWYDAELHSVFVGFVFAMIFGHAPIILPALTGRRAPFHPVLYLPLGLLHISLILRISADLAGWQGVRMWGGVLNETAVLLYLGLFLAAMRPARVQK